MCHSKMNTTICIIAIEINTYNDKNNKNNNDNNSKVVDVV
jgi:hypothetical protein